VSCGTKPVSQFNVKHVKPPQFQQLALPYASS